MFCKNITNFLPKSLIQQSSQVEIQVKWQVKHLLENHIPQEDRNQNDTGQVMKS